MFLAQKVRATTTQEITPKYLVIDTIKFRVKLSPNLGADPAIPVVVLFRGFSFNLDTWTKIGTYIELSRRRTPYLGVDLPRRKETGTQKKNLSELKNYVPLLEKVLREAGIDSKTKLIIVGPSMGGAFALTYALERNDQILGLVLIAPSLSGVDQERLEGLDLPVLLIWGDRDTVFPVEEKGRELKQLLHNSKLLIVKGTGHAVYLDRPEEFHELLFDFVDELVA